MSKTLYSGDLIAAGLRSSLIAIFTRFWPDGMVITVENAQRAASTGINVFPIAKQILPTQAWDAYIVAEGQLIEAHKAAFDSRRQALDEDVALSKLGMIEVMASIASTLTERIAEISRDPVSMTGWDSNPEIVRAPFNTAQASLEAGIAAQARTHNELMADYAQTVQAADAQLELDKITALVSIIDALPEDEPSPSPAPSPEGAQ